MKRFRVFYGGLAGLAAACALGAWFAPVEAGWLAFPWGSIGAGLRVLSLSGSVGNVAACGLYALLCLLPAGIALRDIRHHWPLVGFSAVLGPALYFLINPGLLAQRMGGLPQEVVVAMLGQLIWAVALACAVWLLLGALHRRSLNTSSLLHGIQIGLCLLDGAFVVSVFGVGGAGSARADCRRAAGKHHAGQYSFRHAEPHRFISGLRLAGAKPACPAEPWHCTWAAAAG